MKRSISALLLAVFLSVLCIPCAAADTAPPKVREYSGFTDVPQGSWCYNAVKLCYEAGLMNGTSETAFSPSAPFTPAQTEVVAARLHRLLNDGTLDIPAAPKGSGTVTLSLPDGTPIPISTSVSASGQRDNLNFFIELLPECFAGAIPTQILLTVDGEKTFTGQYDSTGSNPKKWLWYRFQISAEEFARWSPYDRFCRAEEGAPANTWYLDADLYLKSLPGAENVWFYPRLSSSSGEDRITAVKLFSFVTADCQLAPISALTPPDSTDPDVLRFYAAGILTGTDAQGTFDEYGTFTRGQAAVILARVLDPGLRIGADGSSSYH